MVCFSTQNFQAIITILGRHFERNKVVLCCVVLWCLLYPVCVLMSTLHVCVTGLHCSMMELK